MRTGKYDGVSASGDATLRLIAAGDVAPVNTDLLENYDGRLRGAQGQAAQLRRRPDVRRSPRPRRQPADVAHGQGDAGADSLERRLATRLAVQGQGHGVRQPDLHRGRRALPDGDPARSRDRQLYELDEDQFQAAVDLLKQQRTNIGEYWSDAAKEIQAFASGSTVVGTTWQVPGQRPRRRTRLRSRRRCRRRARPGGPTPG